MNPNDPWAKLSPERKANQQAVIENMRRLTPWGTALFVTAIGATGAFILKMRLAGMTFPCPFYYGPLGLGILGACFEVVLWIRFRETRREVEPDAHRRTKGWRPGLVGLIFFIIPLSCGIAVTLGVLNAEMAPLSNCPNFCPNCGAPWPN